MSEEFCLSDKRKELVQVLREKFGIHNSKAWSIIKRVEEQDKEFIKKLKEIDIVGLVRENCREEAEKKINFRINELSKKHFGGIEK